MADRGDNADVRHAMTDIEGRAGFMVMHQRLEVVSATGFEPVRAEPGIDRVEQLARLSVAPLPNSRRPGRLHPATRRGPLADAPPHWARGNEMPPARRRLRRPAAAAGPQADCRAVRRRRTAPTRPNPAISIIKVPGSGTASPGLVIDRLSQKMS